MYNTGVILIYILWLEVDLNSYNVYEEEQVEIVLF